MSEEKEEKSYPYLCSNCNFNFTYEGDLKDLQCLKCRCENITKIK